MGHDKSGSKYQHVCKNKNKNNNSNSNMRVRKCHIFRKH